MGNQTSRFLWAAPAITFLVLFFLYPLWLLIDTSLREVSLGSVARTDNPFVGLENYRALAQDPDFRAAVPRTILYLIGTVSISSSSASRWRKVLVSGCAAW
jgi:ABC-type sugar transport system permease subunit